MAARSPIVLDSSSPNRTRSPSITPQSRHRRSSGLASSSSGLASPSTFVLPLAPGLTSGSRAQQIPQNAPTGFASAATLLRSHHFEASIEIRKDEEDTIRGKEDEVGTGKAAQSKKTTGKLSRPSKAKGLKSITKNGTLSLRSPLQDFSYQDYTITKDHKDAESPLVAKNGPKKYRQPSMSVSEYDFPGVNAEPAAPLPAAPAKTKKNQSKAAQPKKTRKRAADQDDVPETVRPKKPRKKLAKSESIILNSDEPDPLPLSDEGRATTVSITSVEKPSVCGDHSTSRNPPTAQYLNETSTYFTMEQPGVQIPQATTREDASSLPLDSDRKALATAPRRRLSWTPAKDTVETNGACSPAYGPEQPVFTDGQRPSLTDIISGLGYSNQETRPSPERPTTDKSLTKRRRIELADASTVPLAQQAVPKLPPAENPKKVKAPKKKPQTITDLATKAYRPEEAENRAVQPTASTFFAAQSIDTTPSVGNNDKEEVVKPKKPRKPRTKKIEGDAKGPKPAKPVKPKRMKAGETTISAKLYSPGAARAEENSQRFLFGTSSQLAVDDSPTFIRQMQVALRDSEILTATQERSSPVRKSRIRTASAPDGTNLFVGRAYSDHWCVAARDGQGDVLNSAAGCSGTKSGSRERNIPSGLLQNANLETAAIHSRKPEDSAANIVPIELGEQINNPPDAPMSPQDLPQPRELVDLCKTSPTADPQGVSNPEAHSGVSQDINFHAVNVSVPLDPPYDDGWMLLSSDDPPPAVSNGPYGAPEQAIDGAVLNTAPARRPPTLSRAATSPSLGRPALQALDANASIMTKTSPLKDPSFSQHRLVSTTAHPFHGKESRPQGPQADSNLLEGKSAPTKRRSRPPRKKADPQATAGLSPRSVQPPIIVSASQPTASTEWVNIDDISDSDTPATPSPPRRRAKSPPPAIKPLVLETIASPSMKTKASTSTSSSTNIKASGENWPSLMATIFPQITAAVKSVPPSLDIAHLTWHERILLYEPIVLEDLTAWLNDQGLRIKLQRLKPKAKPKGRKKKDTPPDLPEYETVKEELKPWMIQKWCEDRSICCLWKEGMNGGRRNRY